MNLGSYGSIFISEPDFVDESTILGLDLYLLDISSVHGSILLPFRYEDEPSAVLLCQMNKNYFRALGEEEPRMVSRPLFIL